MVRISNKTAQELGLVGKSKYNNNKIKYQGLTFDSKKEFEYYLILKDKEKRGLVFNLKRQVPLEIQPAFTDKTGVKHRAIIYKADFVYTDRLTGKERYIDVKGSTSTLTEVYKLKKKLLAYKNIIIEEVY
jgi:hypothetical protein